MAAGLGCSADQSAQSVSLYHAAEPCSSIGVSSGVRFLIPNTGLLKHSPRLTEEQAGGGGLVSFGPVDVSKPSHVALSLLSVCEEFTSKISTLEKKLISSRSPFYDQ